jgi:hypothetical protein
MLLGNFLHSRGTDMHHRNTVSTVTSHPVGVPRDRYVGSLVVAQQRDINIRRIVACAYRGVSIEPLHGNDHVLLARA